MIRLHNAAGRNSPTCASFSPALPPPRAHRQSYRCEPVDQGLVKSASEAPGTHLSLSAGGALPQPPLAALAVRPVQSAAICAFHFGAITQRIAERCPSG